MVSENNKESIGKYSVYASYVFRFLIILCVLTPFMIATKGIGTIFIILFYKFILKIIPFRISLYLDYQEYQENKITLELLYNQWKKKYNYTLYLLAFIILSLSLILINDNNNEDRILFSILLIVLLLISIPQILFLNYIKKSIIGNFKPEIVKTKSIEKKSFSLYNFYFDGNTNSVKVDDKTEKSNLFKKAKNYINLIKLNRLKNDEIVIVSVILGLVTGLILGYFFGSTIYTDNEGIKYSYTNEYIVFEEFHFNYILALASFVIISGIVYVILKRQTTEK